MAGGGIVHEVSGGSPTTGKGTHGLSGVWSVQGDVRKEHLEVRGGVDRRGPKDRGLNKLLGLCTAHRGLGEDKARRGGVEVRESWSMEKRLGRWLEMVTTEMTLEGEVKGAREGNIEAVVPARFERVGGVAGVGGKRGVVRSLKDLSLRKEGEEGLGDGRVASPSLFHLYVFQYTVKQVHQYRHI